MFLSRDNGSLIPNNAVLIPGFGGFQIYSVANHTETSSVFLDRGLLKPILQVFLSQLRRLLGILPWTVAPNGAFVLTAVESNRRGITAWELDQLYLIRIVQFLSQTRSTLRSLPALLERIETLALPGNVQQLLLAGLAYERSSKEHLARGRLVDSLRDAREAFRMTEEASFSPGMLSTNYFPDEHKYAVYVPLFLPVFLPLLVQTIKFIRSNYLQWTKTVKVD